MEREVELGVGDVLRIGSLLVTVVAIDDGEVAFELASTERGVIVETALEPPADAPTRRPR